MSKRCRAEERWFLLSFTFQNNNYTVSAGVMLFCSQLKISMWNTVCLLQDNRQHSSFHKVSNKSNAQLLRSRPFPAQKDRHWAFDERQCSSNNDCLQFYSHCRLCDNTFWSDTHWTLMTEPDLNRADIRGMRKMLLKELNVMTIQQPISMFNVSYSGDDGTQRCFQIKWNWSVTQHHPDQRNKTLNVTFNNILRKLHIIWDTFKMFQTWPGRLYDYYLYLITGCFKLTRDQIRHVLWWQKALWITSEIIWTKNSG